MSLRWPKILVTGAGGFIGSGIVGLLYRAGATDIRAGMMRDARSGSLGQLPIEIVWCDVMKPESLDAALIGIDVVVNCAHSRVEAGPTVEGTRHLLDRAAAMGVRRFIHMSTVAVYGDALGVVTEETFPVSPVNLYGQQKWIAEQLCQSAACPLLTVAVLRPTLVYGPHSQLWTTLYVKRIVAGQLKQLGAAGEGNANLIYVDDLARFVGHLAVTQLPDYSVYNANGPEIPTFNVYFSRLSQALEYGRLSPPSISSGFQAALRRPVRSVGRYLLKRHPHLLKVARNSRALSGMINRTEADLRLRPNEGELRMYGMNVTYSALRAKAIGFEPQVSLSEGLAASVKWAKEVGMIK
jgi:nucleoside-diphosphate-sugar epimerase